MLNDVGILVTEVEIMWYVCTARHCWLSHYMKRPHMLLMQTTQQLFKIEETEKQDSLLEILSDKYCRAIIESIIHKPKSVIEITNETKIPMSTVYRRVQTLHDSKLLATSGTITEDGKRLFLYKSKVKGIQSVFNGGKVEVELILNV